MKLNIGKIVDNITRGSCIPIDSVRSSGDYSSLVHSIGTGACIDSDKTNPASVSYTHLTLPTKRIV